MYSELYTPPKESVNWNPRIPEKFREQALSDFVAKFKENPAYQSIHGGELKGNLWLIIFSSEELDAFAIYKWENRGAKRISPSKAPRPIRDFCEPEDEMLELISLGAFDGKDS